MIDENTEPSAGAIDKPRHWKDRYRWLGVLLMAAFAGFGPAPPPKPPRDLAEYAQIAEDPDGLKLDPEFHFLQSSPDQDASGIDAQGRGS